MHAYSRIVLKSKSENNHKNSKQAHLAGAKGSRRSSAVENLCKILNCVNVARRRNLMGQTVLKKKCMLCFWSHGTFAGIVLSVRLVHVVKVKWLTPVSVRRKRVVVRHRSHLVHVHGTEIMRHCSLSKRRKHTHKKNDKKGNQHKS